MVYDQYGRLVEKKGAGVYDLKFEYTSFGEIAAYTDGNGNRTQFKYDNGGRLIQRIWPDNSTIDYEYNSNGLLSKKSESGRVTTYFYDPMNRLVKTTITQGAESTTTEMAYDQAGRMTAIWDANSKIEFSYDNFDRITLEKGPVGEIVYGYNGRGLLASKTCSFNGSKDTFATEYYYDDLNRVSMVKSPSGEFTYQYNKQGRIDKLITVPFDENGKSTDKKMIETREYDKAGRLTAKWHQVGEEKKTLLCSYVYDNLDRRVKATVNDISWEYGYDESNQLVSGKSSDGKSYEYAYDKIGNHLKNNGTLLAYNSLNQISSPGFEYDKWSNMVKTPDAEYKFDLHNRLVEVKKTDGVEVKYSYDPMGQRIASCDKNSNKNSKYIICKMIEIGEIVESKLLFHTIGLDLKNSLAYTGAIGAVLATQSTKGEDIFYQYDGNGNVIQTKGNILDKVEKYTYAPFGKKNANNNAPFGFLSMTSDSTGYDYHGIRFYNPDIGRWMNRDPIWERDHLIIGSNYNTSTTNMSKHSIRSHQRNYKREEATPTHIPMISLNFFEAFGNQPLAIDSSVNYVLYNLIDTMNVKYDECSPKGALFNETVAGWCTMECYTPPCVEDTYTANGFTYWNITYECKNKSGYLQWILVSRIPYILPQTCDAKCLDGDESWPAHYEDEEYP